VKTVFNFFCELERVVGVLFETKQHILFVPSAAPESFANVFLIWECWYVWSDVS